MGKVIISPQPIKTSQRIDFNGNVIDPRSKQVLIPKEEDYVPPVIQTQPEPQTTPITSQIEDGLSVLQQIEATKKKLAELEELKKLKIAEKKAELELLEQ